MFRSVNEAFRRATELGSSHAAVHGVVDRSCRSDVDFVETKAQFDFSLGLTAQKVESIVPSLADCLLNTEFMIRRIAARAWARSLTPNHAFGLQQVRRDTTAGHCAQMCASGWRCDTRCLGLPSCVVCLRCGGGRRGCRQALPDAHDRFFFFWYLGTISNPLTWVQSVESCTAKVTMPSSGELPWETSPSIRLGEWSSSGKSSSCSADSFWTGSGLGAWRQRGVAARSRLRGPKSGKSTAWKWRLLASLRRGS